MIRNSLIIALTTIIFSASTYSEDKWAMFMKSGQMVEFLDRSGSKPTASGLKFHAVLTRVETSWMSLPVQEIPRHVSLLMRWNAHELRRMWRATANCFC